MMQTDGVWRKLHRDSEVEHIDHKTGVVRGRDEASFYRPLHLEVHFIPGAQMTFGATV